MISRFTVVAAFLVLTTGPVHRAHAGASPSEVPQKKQAGVVPEGISAKAFRPVTISVPTISYPSGGFHGVTIDTPALKYPTVGFSPAVINTGALKYPPQKVEKIRESGKATRFGTKVQKTEDRSLKPGRKEGAGMSPAPGGFERGLRPSLKPASPRKAPVMRSMPGRAPKGPSPGDAKPAETPAAATDALKAGTPPEALLPAVTPAPKREIPPEHPPEPGSEAREAPEETMQPASPRPAAIRGERSR